MPYYKYIGINLSGDLCQGRLKSTNKAQAAAVLSQQHITPLYLQRHYSQLPHKKHQQVRHFTQQLALLLEAAVPIDQAINTLCEAETSSAFLFILNAILNDITSGKSLLDSLQAFPDYFTTVYLSFIKTAETSGDLSQGLLLLHQYLEKQFQLKSQLYKILSYPIFLLISTFVLGLFITLFIIPKYQSFFQELGGHLPKLTQLVFAFANGLTHYQSLLILSLIGLGFIILRVCCHQTLTITWHKLNLNIPIISHFVRLQAITHWSTMMAFSLSAHIPLIESITLANRSIKNKILKIQFEQFPAYLSEGKSLQDCMIRSQCFSAPLLSMIAIAETTGNFACIFQKIAQQLQQQYLSHLTQWIKRSEPIIMLGLATITGLLIAALYLPMVSLGLNL